MGLLPLWLIKTLSAAAMALCINHSVDARQPDTLQMATTEWCPYICENHHSGMQGIIYDYMHYLAPQLGSDLNVSFFPWSRAIQEVTTAKQHGLLTAIPAEAPQLQFTKTPTMTYQICFFTRPDTAWQYKSADSLDDTRIGVIADYGYGEPVDSFIAEHQSQRNIFTLTGDNPLPRLIEMVLKDRIDVLVADSNVVKWLTSQKPQWQGALHKSGCLAPKPFYMAFNADLSWSQDVINRLDMLFAQPQSQQYLQENILPGYQNTATTPE